MQFGQQIKDLVSSPGNVFAGVAYSWLLDTAHLPTSGPVIFSHIFPTYLPMDADVVMAIGWQRLYDTSSMPYDYSFTLDSINVFYDTIEALPVPLNAVARQSNDYRYGYNGQMKNDEWAGRGHHLDFGARLYDPRIGRFLTLDPLSKKYAGFSPYSFALNSPIAMIDNGGNHGEIVIHKGGAPYSSDPKSKTTVTATVLIYTTYEKQGELRSFYSNPEGPGSISKSQDGWNGTFNLPNYDATFNVQFIKPLASELELNAKLQNPIANSVETNNAGNGVSVEKPTQGRRLWLQPGRYEGTYGHSISHEIAHLLGLGHFKYTNGNGVSTISAYTDPRAVIEQDIQMIIDPAVELANQYSGQDITVHIFAFTDANGQPNFNMATYKVYDPQRKQYIQSVTLDMLERANQAARHDKKDEPNKN